MFASPGHLWPDLNIWPFLMVRVCIFPVRVLPSHARVALFTLEPRGGYLYLIISVSEAFLESGGNIKRISSGITSLITPIRRVV